MFHFLRLIAIKEKNSETSKSNYDFRKGSFTAD